MKVKKYCLKKPTFAGKNLFLLLCILSSCLNPFEALAKEEFDEVPVVVRVKGLESTELLTIIQGKNVYLPVSDFFDYLKIKNSVYPGLDSVSGFFIQQNAPYYISKTSHTIDFQGKKYALEPDELIQTTTGLYLKSNYFGEVFGLHCSFHFRSLSMLVKTDLELPVIRERRREEMRRNLNRLKDDFLADTTFGRTNPFFQLGMADWSVNNTQIIAVGNGEPNSASGFHTRFNLGLGAVVAGGEANARFSYDRNMPFDHRSQYYQWRYANNDNAAIRQVMAGRINTYATATLLSPIIGVQVSNTPTNSRKSFGSYTISDFTEPDWLVELYLNNSLVDYVKADNSGFYAIEVPLFYGSQQVKLHFYGPWGEERVVEKNILIPFNFLPSKEVEYTSSLGIIEDQEYSRFFRNHVNYGLNRNVTIGGGVEFLSSVSSGPFMPFLNSSVRIAPGLVFTGEYAHRVRAKGLLRLQRPGQLNVELLYINYHKEQKALFYNFHEERRISVSKLLRTKKINLFSQFVLNQIIYPETKSTKAELLFSGTILGVAAQIVNHAVFTEVSDPFLYSNASFSLRLPAKFNLLMQTQYGYNRNRFMMLKSGVERNFRKAYVNVSYEQNLAAGFKSIELGLRYNFSFSQVSVRTRFFQNNMMIMQAASGGINYDQRAQSVGFNTLQNVGKGAIKISSFLDLNNNGKRDAHEPKVQGLNPSVRGGKFRYHEKDTSYYLSNLSPYMDYFIKLDQTTFPSISWQIKDQFIKVMVEPNFFKRIEVPISVAGEVSGMVFADGTSDSKGIGRVMVNIYTSDGGLIGSAMSEGDGYFSYFGLPSGEYTARLDAEQLKKIQMTARHGEILFTIKNSGEGDYVDDLEFFLRKTGG